jgi:hypothetical protein
MKYVLKAPPSLTEQTLSFEIPDLPVSITPVITGTTPPGEPEQPNIPPIVNAGTSQTIQLPVNSVILNGSASDSDGTIIDYKWSKIAGGAANIATPNSVATQVTGLTEGLYSFQLAATDNDGATTTSIVTITVKAAIVIPPSAGYEQIFFSGFDKDSDLDPDGHEQYGRGYIDKTFFKTGTGSFHALPDNKSSGIRSEVQYDRSRVADEGAIQYDVYYKIMSANNAHSFQLHPNTSGASACPGLWHRDGTLYMTFKLPNSTPEVKLFKPVLNTWYTIRHEYKMSTGTDGYWRVYVNGVLTGTEYKGRTAYDNGWWPKIGVNSWSPNTQSSNELFIDNLFFYKKV